MVMMMIGRQRPPPTERGEILASRPSRPSGTPGAPRRVAEWLAGRRSSASARVAAAALLAAPPWIETRLSSLEDPHHYFLTLPNHPLLPFCCSHPWYSYHFKSVHDTQTHPIETQRELCSAFMNIQNLSSYGE